MSVFSLCIIFLFLRLDKRAIFALASFFGDTDGDGEIGNGELRRVLDGWEGAMEGFFSFGFPFSGSFTRGWDGLLGCV